MAQCSYREIYYASTEKSANGGFSGFGVRAYTEGMDASEVDIIINSGINKYPLSGNRMLTYSQIQENPKIVYDYAPILLFTKVEVGGKDKYVIGRIVYLAIDYGYFCGGDALRTGSNYFAHYLVFDEMPPFGIFNEISASLFVPKDYTCSPNNPELVMLLTGEPPVLHRQTREIPDVVAWGSSFDEDAARCLVGYLQAYVNKQKQTSESLQKIIIKAPAAKTSQLVQHLALLPKELSFVASFVTNYTRGGGVPTRYQMVFVNEFNEDYLYEDSHVVVDVFSKTTQNVDNNIFYDKIIEFAQAGELDLLQKLVDYYLKLDLSQEQDFSFLYSLFVALQTDKAFDIEDLTNGFTQKISQVNLTPQEDSLLWSKINDCLNVSLQSDSGAILMQAILILEGLLKQCPEKIALSHETIGRMNSVVLFGANPYLHRLAVVENLDAILYITKNTLIPSESNFYQALKLIDNVIIWQKLLVHYYEDRIEYNKDAVLDNILDSRLSTTDKEKLIQQIYPLSRYKESLYEYVCKHSNQLYAMQNIIQPILLESVPERFSDLLESSGDDVVVINILTPWVVTYYQQLIAKDAESGIQKLIAFVNSNRSEVFKTMSITHLFTAYIDKKLDTPKFVNLQTLEQISQLNIDLDAESKAKLEALTALVTNQVPDSVEQSFLTLAWQLDKKTDDLVKLYEVWLQQTPSVETLKSYLIDVKDLIDSAYIEQIILATWKSRLSVIQDNREDYVLTILDNTKWDKASKKAFIETCNSADLVEFLQNNSGFGKQFIKKISNLFH